MACEFNMYSGTCKYKDINFTFIFNGEELQLVPPPDKRETILTTFIFLKSRYIHLRIREDTRNLQQCTCLMRMAMTNHLH